MSALRKGRFSRTSSPAAKSMFAPSQTPKSSSMIASIKLMASLSSSTTRTLTLTIHLARMSRTMSFTNSQLSQFQTWFSILVQSRFLHTARLAQERRSRCKDCKTWQFRTYSRGASTTGRTINATSLSPSPCMKSMEERSTICSIITKSLKFWKTKIRRSRFRGWQSTSYHLKTKLLTLSIRETPYEQHMLRNPTTHQVGPMPCVRSKSRKKASKSAVSFSSQIWLVASAPPTASTTLRIDRWKEPRLTSHSQVLKNASGPLMLRKYRGHRVDMCLSDNLNLLWSFVTLSLRATELRSSCLLASVPAAPHQTTL